MKTQTINIQGMSCEHCTSSVTNAVSAMDGVQTVTVSLENKCAVVIFDEGKTSIKKISDTIENIGFDVV